MISDLKPLQHLNMQNTQGFYNYVRNEYNQQLVTDIKLYEQFTSNLKKREIERKFLLQCRSHNILPNQILNQTHINIRFFPKHACEKIENSTKLFGTKILNFGITDISHEIKQISKDIYYYRMKIIDQTSNDFYNNLNTKNPVTIEKFTNKLQNNIINNLKNLKVTKIPILVTDRKNWFINMSNKEIPDSVADILSLGGKFAFNYNKKTFPTKKKMTGKAIYFLL